MQMAILNQPVVLYAPAAQQAPPAVQPAPTQAVRQIEYIPMAREAQQRQSDTALLSFRMTKGSYDAAYGSTNGGWRDVTCSGRRFVLPAGCAPRRARRFM